MSVNTSPDDFSALYIPEPNSGCWLWLGHVNSQGYGQHKKRRAHRESYEIHVGNVPDGLVLDHLCRVRSCVNPAHLEPVTNKENILRGESPWALNARKTHCPRGHLLSEDNLRRCFGKNAGNRECKACSRENCARNKRINRMRRKMEAQEIENGMR